MIYDTTLTESPAQKFETRIPLEYLSKDRMLKEIELNFPKYSKIRLFSPTGSEIIDESDVQYFYSSKEHFHALFFTQRNENFNSKHLLELYDLEHKLGEGGFGKVFLGKNKMTGELIAIKIFRHSISFVLIRIVKRFLICYQGNRIPVKN